MRVPVIAACTLTALVVQDWQQCASAGSETSTHPPETQNSQSTGAAPADPVEAIASPDVFAVPSSINSNSEEPPQPVPLTAEAAPVEAGGRAIEIPVIPPAPAPLPPGDRTVQREQIPANPQPAQQTQVRIQGEALPVPGALPADFSFPIRTEIVTDATVTTNTPITDQEFPDPLPRSNVSTLEQLARYRESRSAALTTWAGQVRECLQAYPWLVSTKPDGARTPVLFNEQRGTIVRNANGQLVCLE